jgi:hypothetical protein
VCASWTGDRRPSSGAMRGVACREGQGTDGEGRDGVFLQEWVPVL